MWHMMLSRISSRMPLSSMLVLSFDVWNVYRRIRLKIWQLDPEGWASSQSYDSNQGIYWLTIHQGIPVFSSKWVGSSSPSKLSSPVSARLCLRGDHTTWLLAYLYIRGLMSFVRPIESYDALRYIKNNCSIIESMPIKWQCNHSGDIPPLYVVTVNIRHLTAEIAKRNNRSLWVSVSHALLLLFILDD